MSGTLRQTCIPRVREVYVNSLCPSLDQRLKLFSLWSGEGQRRRRRVGQVPLRQHSMRGVSIGQERWGAVGMGWIQTAVMPGVWPNTRTDGTIGRFGRSRFGWFSKDVQSD